MARTNSEVHRLATGTFSPGNVAEWCGLFHPTRSVYIDPIFGEFHTQKRIREWLVTAMQRAGSWGASPAGDHYFDGNVAFGEAVLEIEVGVERIPLHFCWVQRYADGWIEYRRDYYDSFALRQTAPAAALRYQDDSAS